MGKYIYGFDILQEMMIAIPVEGSIIYPDLRSANKTIPETAKSNRQQVNSIIGWLQEHEAPLEMLNFIASILGSRVDKVWDYNGAQMMINHNGVLYTLKDIKIVDSFEEVIKMKEDKIKEEMP